MTRRAVLLLELLLALAVLVASGMAIGAAVGRTTDSLVRADDRTRAADAAWSAIALIEAGIASPETLNGPGVDGTLWSLRIETQRTSHEGLVLVTAEAYPADGPAGSDARAVATARQYVRLSEVRDAPDRAPEPARRASPFTPGGAP
ncbi:MAG: hypothetical protein DHS20C14_12760 [Phycisphaeraceae bacterium]|nr:MAG: hypothetical protein DHS20C14_12760 [Phycisphaeraceae bacterium]